MIEIKSFTDLKNKEQKASICDAYNTLVSKQGAGNEFLGWLNVEQIASSEIVEDVLSTAALLQKQSKAVVVIGIGGSYLGARAVVEALKDNFSENSTEILFAGHHLSENYMSDLLKKLNRIDYSIIVISKSGTTIEPAIAFRLLKTHCEEKYGILGSKKRIVCITDKEKGALKTIANKNGYKTFVIPDDVGGRYSVLTPVGLLPIAIAGFDIKKLILGAKNIANQLQSEESLNMLLTYALFRHAMQEKGYCVEVMASFEPKLHYLIEWWKQLFGESEGKNHKGTFPVGLIYTTDLHSMGQYMQDGQRIMFETFLSLKEEGKYCEIPHQDSNEDGLNYIAGRRLSDINHKAKEGTMLAHREGGVPVVEIEIATLNEENIGELIYFFEFSCALTAYALEVNPFNQPGVENYKKNMLDLLKK